MRGVIQRCDMAVRLHTHELTGLKASYKETLGLEIGKQSRVHLPSNQPQSWELLQPLPCQGECDKESPKTCLHRIHWNPTESGTIDGRCSGAGFAGGVRIESQVPRLIMRHYHQIYPTNGFPNARRYHIIFGFRINPKLLNKLPLPPCIRDSCNPSQ